MMPSWTTLLLVIAVVAAVIGFTGLAGAAAWIAQAVFVVCIIVFLGALILRRD